jgi:primosomal protein N' (replication factor Y)
MKRNRTEHPAPRHVDVAVALPLPSTFTYRVPAEMDAFLCAGARVLVPFGRRRVTGYVLGAAEGDPALDIRDITEILDAAPVFPEAMIPLFRWAAAYYLHPVGEVIRGALPAGLNVSDASVFSLTDSGRRRLGDSSMNTREQAILAAIGDAPRQLRTIRGRAGRQFHNAVLQALIQRDLVARDVRLRRDQVRARMLPFVSPAAGFRPEKKLSSQRRDVLRVMADHAELPLADLSRQAGVTRALVRRMAADGQLVLTEKSVYRDPFGDPVIPDRPPDLTDDQERAVASVSGRLENGFGVYLLTGVTGSGKTEVYLQLAATVIRGGRTAIVLVPEIALISQMARRFRARFADRIAVLHSGLSAGERFDQWQRIRSNEARIVIGARSAIWAPLEQVGLIIVDEEHDSSYKQERGLRYNARDLAIVRARQEGCTSLLGSATPSMESCYNAEKGKYKALSLPSRVEQRALPEISIIDLRDHQGRRGIDRFVTPPLHQAILETLSHGEQVLLFLNRRGYATYPVCRACGATLRCRHCDITLTLHQSAGQYRCHYCGFSLPADKSCAECGADTMMPLGMGTERLADGVASLFPKARIARLDRDTTSRKGSALKILKALQHGDVDILIGTQMVAKGHDFPNITLVGIVCADLTLSLPDFRAGERTFQLLAQVAGRAGRGDRPGRVMLQTFNPEHFSIAAARTQDYRVFYSREIEFRKALDYPPFSRFLQYEVSSKNKAAAAASARSLGDALRHLIATHREALGTVSCFGPVEAPLARIAGRFRWLILLKGPVPEPLNRLARLLPKAFPQLFTPPRVRVVVDVDPYHML